MSRFRKFALWGIFLSLSLVPLVSAARDSEETVTATETAAVIRTTPRADVFKYERDEAKQEKKATELRAAQEAAVAAQAEAERVAAEQAVIAAKKKSKPIQRTVEPAPQPEPEPLPPAASGSVEEAIALYFGDIYRQAYNVAVCESGLNPLARSRTNDWGVFQINGVHKQRVLNMGYSWSQILDPFVNAHVARAIYDDSGWGPWACRWAAWT